MPVKLLNAEGKYIFTTDDLALPQGSNGLAAFAAMFQRTLFKDHMYPPVDAGIPTPLDTWYKRGLFGRVDRKQNTIIPKTKNLKQITEAAQPVFALDFVADAFARFVNHMGEAYIAGAVIKTGHKAILAPKAVGGYADPTQQFYQMHQALAEAFIVNFKPPRDNPIENFRTFLKYYIPFLKNVSASVPVTKTNFVLSYMMNPFCTGLSVSIYDGDPAEDKIKYTDFILDTNFAFYTNVAKKFGFLVDKNKPWVLTADLFTKALIDRLEFYANPLTYEQVSPRNFFEVYYDRTYLRDIEDLQRILLSAYRYLVMGAPLCQKENICPNGTFQYKSYPREVYEEAGLRAQLDPKLLIDLYIDLRQAESAYSLTPNQVGALKLRSYQLYKLRAPTALTAFQRTALNINHQYRKYIYPASLSRLTGIPRSAM